VLQTDRGLDFGKSGKRLIHVSTETHALDIVVAFPDWLLVWHEESNNAAPKRPPYDELAGLIATHARFLGGWQQNGSAADCYAVPRGGE
jgi:hypothetical protein